MKIGITCHPAYGGGGAVAGVSILMLEECP